MDEDAHKENNHRRSVCTDVLQFIILKVESRFRTLNRTVVIDIISPLDKTPLSSNFSGTPDQVNVSTQPARKSFNFEGLEETLGSRKVRAPNYFTFHVEILRQNIPRVLFQTKLLDIAHKVSRKILVNIVCSKLRRKVKCELLINSI